MKFKRRLALVLPFICSSLIGCDVKIIRYNDFEYKDKNGFSYYINTEWQTGEKYAILRDIPENKEEIIIPDEVMGLPVTDIYQIDSTKLTRVKKFVLGKNVETFQGAYDRNGKSSYSSGSSSLLEVECGICWPELQFFSCENSKLKNINQLCFAKSTKLREIHLNDGLKTIGDGAFYECNNLENFTFPNSVETIGLSAFQGCKKLNVDLKLPDNIKEIGAAFDDTGIIVHYGSEKGIVSLSTNDGKQCLISYEITKNEGDLVIDYPIIGSYALYVGNNDNYYSRSYNSITLTAKTLPNNIYYNYSSGYRYNELSTDYLYLNNVEYVGHNSLGFVSPKNLVIGGNLQEIEDYAFDVYDDLETISLTNPDCEKYMTYGNVLYETSEEGYGIALFPYNPSNKTITFHERTIGFSNKIGAYRKNTFDRIGLSDFTLHRLFSRPEETDDEERYYYDFLYEFTNKMCAKEYFLTGESNDFCIANGGICCNGELLMGPKLVNAQYTIDSSVNKIKKDAFCDISGTTTFKVSRSVKEIEKYAIESAYEPISIYIPKEVTTIGGQIIRRDSYYNNNVTFYVEASSMPSGWNENCFDNGNYGQHTVYWNQTFDY